MAKQDYKPIKFWLSYILIDLVLLYKIYQGNRQLNWISIPTFTILHNIKINISISSFMACGNTNNSILIGIQLWTLKEIICIVCL